MPEATLQGVTLYSSRSRKKDVEAFELGVSSAGIEVRRSGQEPRLLAWDRVATWELEQRRRNVLLVLRGGGSVTPLLIPGWKVDDLDALLREKTAHLARTTEVPEEGSDLGLPDAVSDQPESGPPADLDLPSPRPAEDPDPDVASFALELTQEESGEASATEGARVPTDLELPEPLPLHSAVEEQPDMDLTLPPPAPDEPAGAGPDMDLRLPAPPPPTEPSALARELGDVGDDGKRS